MGEAAWKAKRAAYRKANPKKIAAWQKKYNAQEWAAYQRKWRRKQLACPPDREPTANCEACGQPYAATFGVNGPQLDHCHARNVFRGWLCRPCNQALGLLREDPARILALHDYSLCC